VWKSFILQVCGFSENHRFDEHEAFMAQRGIGWAATYQRKFLILGEDQVLTTDKTPANFHPRRSTYSVNSRV
jgi:hypothetical protein